MKAHIEVDVQNGLLHKIIGTNVKESDILQFPELLPDEEERLLADHGYNYPHGRNIKLAAPFIHSDLVVTLSKSA